MLLNISSAQRKDKLTNEVLEIEKKLMKSYKEETSYEEKKAVDAIKKNPKYFYRYARRFSKARSNIGPLLDEQGELVSDSYAMANLLMNQYSKMFSNSINVDASTSDHNISHSVICDLTFDKMDLIEAIDELKMNSAPGLDGFPAALLK